jgi:general secretion pathway protein G
LEVLMTIAIIGLIAGLAVPNYLRYRYKAQVVQAISEIRLLEREIADFVSQTDALPNQLTDLRLGPFNDPWGNPYEYLRIDGGDTQGKGKQRKDHFMVPVNGDYDLYSKGKDGKSQSPFTAHASQDDVVRANDGAFIGLVSDF